MWETLEQYCLWQLVDQPPPPCPPDASLEWETFEQYCLWQLVEAHELTIDYILPLLTRIQSREHAEAVSCVMLMLRREE